MSFEPTGLGKSIHEDRYAFSGESWEDSCGRVALAVADRDKGYVPDFYNVIHDGLFSPGGRIWYGAGRQNQAMMNCNVLPVTDSREGWGQLFYDTTVVSGTGGGIGVNFSKIRGKDYPIKGTGGTASGAVSVMKMQSGLGKGIVQGGSRRTALMHSLDINHPDIMEFINVKKDRKQLENANLSLIIPPDMSADSFVDAVKNGRDIPLMFDGKLDIFGRSINAKDFWDIVSHNAWEGGEPGVLNSYLANKESNMWYRYPLETTNPCGEQFLPAYGSCCLGALVLPRFVSNGQTDWKLLARTIRTAVRFLDDVLDVNQFPIQQIADISAGERRIGLGVMGLHSMLLDVGIKYSESHDFVDNLFRFIRDTAYRASIDLAVEKGPFPFYDEKMLASAFCRRLPRGIRQLIKAHGIRNCAILTIAPTGTTSMVQGVTSGIEPMFSPTYFRRVKQGRGKADKVTLVISEDYAKHPDLAEGAYDITPRGHFEIQEIAQPYIDSAVSKTINLPKDYDPADLSDLLLEKLPKVKGFTLYREGSRADEPLEYVPTHKTAEVIASWTGDVDNQGSFSIDSCIDGSCEI